LSLSGATNGYEELTRHQRAALKSGIKDKLSTILCSDLNSLNLLVLLKPVLVGHKFGFERIVFASLESISTEDFY
jgi:hypothetical protein